MEVFRITKEEYSTNLLSSGKANRWNIDGQRVIYVGASRSLATLENIVHRSSIKTAFKFKVMVISISDADTLHTQILQKDLPSDWRKPNNSKLQSIGGKWYKKNQSLVLKVPSVVIPQEFNYIINTQHPDFNDTNVYLVRQEDYFWDDRLL